MSSINRYHNDEYDISETTYNMRICYDIRLEAIYTILLLCDYDIISPYFKKYRQKILSLYGSYRNTKYIRFFNSISKKMFRYTIPCALVLVSELKENILVQTEPLNPYYELRLGGADKAQECFDNINMFLNDTGFLNFFIANRAEYSNYIRQNSKYLFDIMADVQSWYSPENMRYTAYISKLIHPGGFGVSAGQHSAGCVLGSLLKSSGTIDKALTYNICFHEFSHHFIELYIQECWETIKLLLNRVPVFTADNDIQQQEYISETIIRALSNYYCYTKSINLNIQDFRIYPSVKKLFIYLKRTGVSKFDNNLFNTMIEEISKE